MYFVEPSLTLAKRVTTKFKAILRLPSPMYLRTDRFSVFALP